MSTNIAGNQLLLDIAEEKRVREELQHKMRLVMWRIRLWAQNITEATWASKLNDMSKLQHQLDHEWLTAFKSDLNDIAMRSALNLNKDVIHE